jgi:hypothetical protein
MLIKHIETDLRNINFEYIDNETIYTEKSETYAFVINS